jgi:hypothetical protein
MSTFPNSPRLIKGGIVLLDPETAAVRGIISLQYNPDTLTRSLQIQGVSADGGGKKNGAMIEQSSETRYVGDLRSTKEGKRIT